MAHYRAYSLDRDGRVRGVQVLDADTDEAVIAAARTLARAHGLEIWLRDRCLAKLPAAGQASPAARPKSARLPLSGRPGPGGFSRPRS